MTQFKIVASLLYQSIIQLVQLKKRKIQFAKSIKYQINELFKTFCKSALEINHKNMLKIFGKFHIVFKTHNRSLTPEMYIIVDSLVYNLHKNDTICPITQNKILQFQQILAKQYEIQTELIIKLQKFNLEIIFNEIDFFSNGYVDITSLTEFFNHYLSKTIQEQCCKQLIIMIRSHQASKFFIQDLKQFLEGNFESYQQQELNSVSSAPKTIKEQQDQVQLIFTIENSSNSNKNSQYFQGRIDECSLQYEEKLIRNHARNEYYIKQIKKNDQINFSLPLLTTHQLLPNTTINKAQINLQLALIADCYEKQVNLIKNLIVSNPQFTFLNGFNVIDFDGRGYFNKKDFYDFLEESAINLQKNKIEIFIKEYFGEEIIRYSDYLKVFKLRSCRKAYQQCIQRKALLGQGWQTQTKKNYCNFIGNMINIVDKRVKSCMQLIHQVNTEQILTNLFGNSRPIYKEQFEHLWDRKEHPFILQVCDGSNFNNDRFTSLLLSVGVNKILV